MSVADYVGMATRVLLARPVRTILTLIGIFIGISAVVSLVSLGRGLDDAIKTEFQKAGGDKIIITPKGAMSAGGVSDAGNLTIKDIDAIKRVHGISDAAGIVMKSSTVEFNKQVQIRSIVSIPSDKSAALIYEAYDIEAGDGRLLRFNDKGKVMVGYELANDKNYFGQPIKAGNTIYINNTGFKVSGVLVKKGDPTFDTGIVMTESEMRDTLSLDRESLDMIYARATPGVNPEDVAPLILKRLRRDRGEKEGFETIEVQTMTELLQSFTQIFAVVQAVLVGISLISLVVGAVGIMNTMYTSVVERTRDIGIMKSIGASNGQVMSLFFAESAILGFLGGVLGAFFGASLSKLIEIGAQSAFGSPLIKASYPIELMVGVLVFSTLIGIIAGTLPAKQASEQKPVDALRYE